MTNPPESRADISELLEAERELSAAELEELRRLNETYWHYIQEDLARRARQTYAPANQENFAECVREHLDMVERKALVDADVYTCPQCHRLLKDRNTPVASAILLERRRIRELWHDIEVAPEGQQMEAVIRLRRALGL